MRELRNLVERLAILCEGPVVSGAEAEALLPRRRAVAAPALPGTVAPGPGPLALPTAPAPRYRPDRSFRDQVDEAERDIILGALSFAHDNATEAARLLDLERGHFYKKLKSLGLKRAGGETQVEGPPEG